MTGVFLARSCWWMNPVFLSAVVELVSCLLVWLVSEPSDEISFLMMPIFGQAAVEIGICLTKHYASLLCYRLSTVFKQRLSACRRAHEIVLRPFS
jgi:hypothetical protein